MNKVPLHITNHYRWKEQENTLTHLGDRVLKRSLPGYHNQLQLHGFHAAPEVRGVSCKILKLMIDGVMNNTDTGCFQI